VRTASLLGQPGKKSQPPPPYGNFASIPWTRKDSLSPDREYPVWLVGPLASMNPVPSIWDLSTDALNWLNSHPPNSVIYLSVFDTVLAKVCQETGPTISPGLNPAVTATSLTAKWLDQSRILQ